jgi:hypothetical protein
MNKAAVGSMTPSPTHEEISTQTRAITHSREHEVRSAVEPSTIDPPVNYLDCYRIPKPKRKELES